MADFLFEVDEPMGNPKEPEAAWCPECKTVQPIENFRRRPSILQAANWGWYGLRDMKHATYTGVECNECDNKAKRNAKSIDYAAYDRELRLLGKYEYLVPDPREPLYKNVFVTKREEMVLLLRAKRGEGRVRGGIKGFQRKQSPIYTQLLKELRVEKQRAYTWGRQMHGLSVEALEFADLYREYLTTLADRIKGAKTANPPKKALPYVESYMDKTAKLDREVVEAFRELGGAERERLSPRYVL